MSVAAGGSVVVVVAAFERELAAIAVDELGKGPCWAAE